MRLVIRRGAALLALVALPLATIQAQQHRPGIRELPREGRQGFWGVFELGAGVEQVNFDNDGLGYSDALTRPEFAIRLGGTVSEHLRLGGELSGWVNEDNGVTETVGGLLLVAQVYPWRRSGFFLKGGAGLAGSTISDDFGGSTSDAGFAAQLGAGYDLRLGRRVFLVPSVNFNTYRLNGDFGQDYTERITTFGLGIAYQR